jgi:hypothetical protein
MNGELILLQRLDIHPESVAIDCISEAALPSNVDG